MVVGDAYLADYEIDTAVVGGGGNVVYFHGAIRSVSWEINGKRVSYASPEGFGVVYHISASSESPASTSLAVRTAEGYPTILAGTSFESFNGNDQLDPTLDPAILMLFSSRYSWLVSLSHETDPGDYLFGSVDRVDVVPFPATLYLL